MIASAPGLEETLARLFPRVRGAHRDETLDLHVDLESWRDLAAFLRDDARVRARFVDLTARAVVAAGSPLGHRFELTLRCRDDARREDVTLRATVDEGEEIASLAGLWAAAAWAERELGDLFGLAFSGASGGALLAPAGGFGTPLRPGPSATVEGLLPQPEDLFAQIGPWGENPHDDGLSELVPMNVGPYHPATRGRLRLALKLDGERVVRCLVDVGYLHRGVERLACDTGFAGIPDLLLRLSSRSGPFAALAWCRAIEDLHGLAAPARARTVAVAWLELTRIAAHAEALGELFAAVGLDAATAAADDLTGRSDAVIHLLCSGSSSLVRPGGLARDADDVFAGALRDFLVQAPPVLAAISRRVLRGGALARRTREIGRIDAARAETFALSGPNLRASGLGRDLRRDGRTSDWRGFDVAVPVRQAGDAEARTQVRLEEISASFLLLDQVLERLRPGPIAVAVAAIPPAGEAWHEVEAPGGALGIGVWSGGGPAPERVRISSPCLRSLAAFETLVERHRLEDALIALASLGIDVREVDR